MGFGIYKKLISTLLSEWHGERERERVQDKDNHSLFSPFTVLIGECNKISQQFKRIKISSQQHKPISFLETVFSVDPIIEAS